MSASSARGRWSDDETSALIEAWGPMYLGRNGGSLDVAEWRQVCSSVNGRRAAAGCLFNRNRVQCRKRVDTLKDRFKKELAKGQPTSGWRHFGQLRPFLAGLNDGPPPVFAAEMPPVSVKEEEDSCGSVVRRTVPAKRRFSSELSGGPAYRMPASATGGEGPASAGCSRPAVMWKLAATRTMATKLAEIYERVEMERLSVMKQKMAMAREKRAAKVEAEDLGPGETHDE